MKHSIQIRVYYEDTDVAGVVYYANYLRYLERGRTELLRSLDVSLESFHKKGIVFAVTDVAIKYRAPARYDDLLTVETSLLDSGSVAISFATLIFNQHKVLLNTSTTKLVCIGPSGKAARIPDELRQLLILLPSTQ